MNATVCYSLSVTRRNVCAAAAAAVNWHRVLMCVYVPARTQTRYTLTDLSLYGDEASKSSNNINWEISTTNTYLDSIQTTPYKHRDDKRKDIKRWTSVCHHFTVSSGFFCVCVTSDMLSIRPVKHLDTVAFICRPIAVCAVWGFVVALLFSTNQHIILYIWSDIRVRMLCGYAANFKFAPHTCWKFYANFKWKKVVSL